MKSYVVQLVPILRKNRAEKFRCRGRMSGWNAELGEPTGSGKWGKPDKTAKEKGDFVLIYYFDTPGTRDHYFPPNGPWSEDIQKVLAEHKSTWDDFFGKYFVRDKYQNEVFTMFVSAK